MTALELLLQLPAAQPGPGQPPGDPALGDHFHDPAAVPGAVTVDALLQPFGCESHIMLSLPVRFQRIADRLIEMDEIHVA